MELDWEARSPIAGFVSGDEPAVAFSAFLFVLECDSVVPTPDCLAAGDSVVEFVTESVESDPAFTFDLASRADNSVVADV
ncbi:hypothetical protein QJS04_geneDACA001302 [Acorus gramineus]|uniref:Uncharacterized protein n=1 Tax=Acorus gramineus TaxID=55184 RepID=A0AAV9ACB9_ACOGR|nr:hypothetical protein QJS04_geneDACA001302 [Acorus gramineus]